MDWEHDESQQRVVERACAACGARRLGSRHGDRLPPPPTLSSCAAAIVALRGRPGTSACCLDVVENFKQVGIDVIAYEQGAARWPVSERCRVLLAGARYLLDSAEPDFAENLEATLKDLLAALEAQRVEDNYVRQLALARGIVGRSQALLDAFRHIVRMSRLSDLPVLITGETGTGKELFASALHALDAKRCGRPLVAINCAAISKGIVESELFGHVRGAYTGADRDRAGLFQAAHGGVLFLDEIGELDLDVQAKILRVLQEKRLAHVGSHADAPVDVRIVAATHQDLAKMVSEGRFRADLFHRLATLTVDIVPLRERRSDIPLLVEHFVTAHASWRENTGIDLDLIDALSSLDLRGNVRELRNLIASAQASKFDRRPLGLRDMPLHVWKELSEAGIAAPPQSPLPASRQEWNLNRRLAQCEREIVEAALQFTRNNQSQAARLLGLTPRSVYNKLRKYNQPLKTVS